MDTIQIFNEPCTYLGKLGRLHWFRSCATGIDYNLTIEEAAARPEIQNYIDQCINEE